MLLCYKELIMIVCSEGFSKVPKLFKRIDLLKGV